GDLALLYRVGANLLRGGDLPALRIAEADQTRRRVGRLFQPEPGAVLIADRARTRREFADQHRLPGRGTTGGQAKRYQADGRERERKRPARAGRKGRGIREWDCRHRKAPKRQAVLLYFTTETDSPPRFGYRKERRE